MAKDVNVTEFKGDAKNLVNAIDEIKGHSDDLDKSLQLVLTHLNAIEKGFKNVHSITNKAQTVTNDINTKYNTNTFNVGKQRKVIKGSNGSFMGSDTGHEKAFRDYQQAVINETKEITKDIAERRRRRKQIADAQTETANAASLRASKLEDQTSARYLDRMDKLAEARMLNAKANQTGAFLKDPRYQTGRALSTLGGVASNWGSGGKILGGILDSIGMLVKSPVAGTATAVTNLAKVISDLGAEAVKAFSEIEAIKTQLGVVFSNQTQADSMFGQIAQYAVKSPFGVQQTSELAVLLKQSGVYASDLMDTLKMLGDTAGGNMEKMKRIANNYAQIVSIGKASMLDMRQFAYAGIPIFEAVSKELGVSQQQLRKLISDGKVTSDIIEKVFKDLTGINGIFENATEKGAKTLKARLQNLSDARQLAYSSRGERLLNIGSYTGKDGYVTSIVSWMEKLYEEIKDKNELKNIETSVKHIENRENEIEQTKKLIEYLKSVGDDTKYLEQYLKTLEAKRNPDADRATYEAMYKALMSGGKFSVEELSRDVKDILQEEFDLRSENHKYKQNYWANNAYNLMYNNPNGFAGGFLNSGMVATSLFNGMTGIANAAEGSDQRRLVEANQLLIEHLQSLREQIVNLGKITAEQIKAHKETNTINAQQLAYDQMNKNAGARDSLSTSFKELTEIYRSSDEYKQQEEEKRQKRLTDALAYMKKIAENTDDEGKLDVSKYSDGVLSEMNKNGVLNAGRKLSIVTSESNIHEDRAILMRNLNPRLTGGNINFLNSIGATQEADKITALYKSLDNLTDEEFFDQFGTIFDDINSQLDAVLQRVKGNQGYTKKVKEIKEALGISLNEVEIDTEGKAVTAGMLSSSKYDFVPLWKRILASKTGLSTQGMTGTLQTMENYKNDMAIRNMASNVLKATMGSMGVDSAMGLIKTAGNAKQLRGDSGATFQVDWKSTREAIKKFSLALSASTDVITAYKNSLEQELDTYEQLIAAGYTEAESQDLKNQKTVSTKTLEKLSMDAGDQLVNAFGEGLKTKSGKTAFFNGSEFVDSTGNKLQEEEIILTGNLFNFIKDQLPRIYNELHEANVTELNNELIKKMYNEVAPNDYSMRYILNNGYNATTELALSNPEYIAKYLDSKMTELKQDKTNLKGMSNSDIYLNAMAATKRTQELDKEIKELQKDLKENPPNYEVFDYDERADHLSYLTAELESLSEYVNAANDAFKSMDEELQKVTKNEKGETLISKLGTQARDVDVIQKYLSNKRYEEYGLVDPRNITPENYGGARGLRNRLYKYVTGQALASDQEDYIALKLRAEKNTVANINEKRKAAYNKLSPEQQAKKDLQLISEDDLNPLKKSNEELAKMLSYSERIALVWGEEGGEVLKALDNIGVKTGEIIQNFTASAISSTFETWGKTLTSAATDSSEIGKNLAALSASMLKNMGTMITQAGLSLAISSVGDKAKVLTGLAIAAAGGGLSFLGGMIDGATEDNNKEDDEWQKLLKIKQDLADLLKQAREDAIYYENTVRHKKAISANENFTKSVHDAIITPRGDVVTTDPKDYLIATKTPRTLVGSGAPTINFSVIDKSTGVKVTQQRSSYDERTNTIEFEAIIESKIQEVIATSKGDEAFAARESRLNGRTVIA